MGMVGGGEINGVLPEDLTPEEVHLGARKLYFAFLGAGVGGTS